MHLWITIFLFLVGTCFGSLLSMLAYRLPRSLDIVYLRSHCTSCSSILSAKNLVPIFSLMLQRGRCSYCLNKIPVNYLFNELIVGLAFAITYHKCGFSSNFIFYIVLFMLLYLISLIDLTHYIIPDSLQVILLMIALAFMNKPLTGSLLDGLIYFGIGFIAATLVKLFKKQQALGYGDLKFLFITGFYLPYQISYIFFFISGFSGLIMGLIWQKLTSQKLIPFAPSLALALYICIIIYI